MAYTSEGILNQVFVSFGQGTGPMRVANGVCLDLRERYTPRIDAALLSSWDREAVQVLERIRAMGRTAAAEAALAGRTAVSRADARAAVLRVETVSITMVCDGGVLFPPETAAPYTQESILDQILVAFGQGTGAVRVASDAAAALRERYEPYVDERNVADWGTIAVQVLERIRTMGRVAAKRAVEEAGTVVTRAMVREAIERVEKASMTERCPPAPAQPVEEPSETALAVSIR